MILTQKEVLFFSLCFCFLLLVGISNTLLFIISVLVSLFIYKRKEVYFVWSLAAPRITGVGPLIEYILAFAREEGPGDNVLNDVLKIELPFVKPFFFVFKPEYLNRILSAEAENFRTTGYDGPVALMAQSGKNIFTAEGPPSPHWKLYREVVSGMNEERFSADSVMARLFNSSWNSLQELHNYFQTRRGADVDLFFELHHVLVPTLNRAIFGEEFAKKFTYKEMANDIHGVLMEVGPRFTFPIVPPAKDKKFKEQVNRVAEAVKQMGQDPTSPVSSLLLAAHKKGLISDEELQSNFLILAYAHAPLHAIFWTIYCLSLHPDEEKRVLGEISSVLAKGPLTYERLDEFKYLNRVIAEALRLYPSVGLMQVRTVKKNTNFGKHFVPEGAMVFLSHYVIHRNARYWPNPDDFNPMREGIESFAGESLKFLPFGFGPRICAGRYYAQTLIKTSVITFLQHYQFELAPGQECGRPATVVFLNPEKPVLFRVKERPLPKPEPVIAPVAIPQISVESADTELQQPGPSLLKKRGPPPRLSKTAANKLLSQSSIFREALNVADYQKPADPQTLILYGSQSGKARSFAFRLVKMTNLCKMSAVCMSMAELDVSTIKKYKSIIIATSTFGDGGPPENAESFTVWLSKQQSPLLDGINFSVLSLGSTMYPHPFKFGNYLSRRFVQLGAKQLLPDSQLDDIKYNQEEEFTTWSGALFEKLSQTQTEAKGLVARNKLLGFQNFDFNLMSAPFSLEFTGVRLKKEPRLIFGENVVVTQVFTNELVSTDKDTKLYSIELKYQPNSVLFEAGDNVSVLASNNPVLVEKFIQRIEIDKDVVFTVTPQIGGEIEMACSAGKNKCTPEIAFAYFYDITGKPTPSLLKFFAMHSSDASHQETLTNYAANYRSFLLQENSIMDILEMFPSIQFFNNGRKDEDTLAILLGLLGPIRHRYYSIASSPDVTHNIVRIVYKEVQYTTKSGVEKYGLCSNYLSTRKHGDNVAITIARSKFHLPEEKNVPIIMVGAGSGISPYFSFIEQRDHIQKSGTPLGKAVLIHGCRSDADFAMKKKVEDALYSGLLSDLWPAYSRKQGTKHTHVQDIIEEQGAALWNLLENENAIIYICGDIRIGVTVRDAFITVAKQHGNLNTLKAHAWLENMSNTKRLRHDEWGISTASGESVIRAARLRLWRKSIMATLVFAKLKST